MHLIQLHKHGAVTRVRLPKTSVEISSIYTVVLPGVREGYSNRVSIHSSAVEGGELLTDVTVVTNRRRHVVMSSTPESSKYLVLVIAPEEGWFDLHRTVGSWILTATFRDNRSQILTATFRDNHPDQIYRSIALRLERGMGARVEFNEGPPVDVQWEGDRSIIVNGNVIPFPGEKLAHDEPCEPAGELESELEADEPVVVKLLSEYDEEDEGDDDEDNPADLFAGDENPELQDTGFRLFTDMKREGHDLIIDAIEPDAVLMES